MKIMPLFKARLVRPELASLLLGGKKSMVVLLAGTEEFPAGTPDEWEGVRIFRGKINHFHDVTGLGDMVPAGWDPDGIAVVPSKRLGSGRRKLRRFLAQFAPVDRCAQRAALRRLVREGD